MLMFLHSVLFVDLLQKSQVRHISEIIMFKKNNELENISENIFFGLLA